MSFRWSRDEKKRVQNNWQNAVAPTWLNAWSCKLAELLFPQITRSFTFHIFVLSCQNARSYLTNNFKLCPLICWILMPKQIMPRGIIIWHVIMGPNERFQIIDQDCFLTLEFQKKVNIFFSSDLIVVFHLKKLNTSLVRIGKMAFHLGQNEPWKVSVIADKVFKEPGGKIAGCLLSFLWAVDSVSQPITA